MKSKHSGRREFLKDGVVLAGVAVGAMGSANAQTPGTEKADAPIKDPRAYGERSRFVDTKRMPSGPGPAALNTPLQDSAGIITPSPLHFVIARWGYPDIDPRQHRLMIHGMVDRPLVFTLDELKRLPSVTRVHFVECAGNSSPVMRRVQQNTVQGFHGWTSCSEWTGVPLSILLKEAGVQKGADWLVAQSADAGGHAKSIPMGKAMEDVLVVYMQNGEPVRPEQGYPLRLLVPGFEGVSNVKWLKRIKVVDQPYMVQPESVEYAFIKPSMNGKGNWFNLELGPKSVITFPSGGQQLPGAGFYQITGLAWSGGGAIRRVEVSTDGGRTWKDAEIQGPVHRIAHTRFRFDWNWNGEEALLQSRCTDDRGDVQPSVAEKSKQWGVNEDYWKTTKNKVQHWNSIQTWKLARDGSVQNALFA